MAGTALTRGELEGRLPKCGRVRIRVRLQQLLEDFRFHNSPLVGSACRFEGCIRAYNTDEMRGGGAASNS